MDRPAIPSLPGDMASSPFFEHRHDSPMMSWSWPTPIMDSVDTRLSSLSDERRRQEVPDWSDCSIPGSSDFGLGPSKEPSSAQVLPLVFPWNSPSYQPSYSQHHHPILLLQHQNAYCSATSPSTTAIDSCDSANFSDTRDSPYMTPQPAMAANVCYQDLSESVLHGCGQHQTVGTTAADNAAATACGLPFPPGSTMSVSMDQVQGMPDIQVPDESPCLGYHDWDFPVHDQGGFHRNQPEEVFAFTNYDELPPNVAHGKVDTNVPVNEVASTFRREIASPTAARGRRTASAKTPATAAPNTTAHRVQKPPHAIRQRQHHRSSNSQRYNNERIPQLETSKYRAFPCLLAPYGCQSAFGSKNEWKRHINTQHILLTYWICNQCNAPEGVSEKAFNRKDLFTQHLRRMHPVAVANGNDNSSCKNSSATSAAPLKKPVDAETAALAKVAARCQRQRAPPPAATCCIICDEQFRGPAAWDTRLEHIGRHMEDAKKNGPGDTKAGPARPHAAVPETWRPDAGLEAYLLEHGIIKRCSTLTTATGRKGLILIDSLPQKEKDSKKA